jgi:1-acyl-sn-glycerol-3-phosphate acyltransferase
LIYPFLHWYARLAIKIYCRHIHFNDKKAFVTKGPLLIAANHPNSFLDAVIIATLFKYPVYSLARGDVFKGRLVPFILKILHIMPVYRITEGAANIGHNYKTFDACSKIFKQNGHVLIFCEGYCVNEWHLRPIKKGPARLALQAWENNIPLQILPVGINYDAFRSFGKNMIINTGTPVTKNDFNLNNTEGRNIAELKEVLTRQMQHLVLEIDANDTEKRKSIFYQKVPLFKKIALALPALAGLLLHLPFFIVVKTVVQKIPVHNAHYDSLLACTLAATYPGYLIGVAVILLLLLGGWWWLAVFILMPALAWCCVQLKPQ